MTYIIPIAFCSFSYRTYATIPPPVRMKTAREAQLTGPLVLNPFLFSVDKNLFLIKDRAVF